jgi:hypothetical protein
MSYFDILNETNKKTCMDREYFIQLTLGLYRVTEMLSDKEPLRYKIRESANKILADMASTGFDVCLTDQDSIIKEISILSAYFDIAQDQEWINKKNFLVLKQGYINLKEAIFTAQAFKKPQIQAPKQTQVIESRSAPEEYNSYAQIQEKPKVSQQKASPKPVKTQENGYPDRKGEIYDIVSKKGPLRLISMLQYFPNVSKRTIRRDLGYLIKKGAISRYDEGKLTFYKLKNA